LTALLWPVVSLQKIAQAPNADLALKQKGLVDCWMDLGQKYHILAKASHIASAHDDICNDAREVNDTFLNDAKLSDVIGTQAQLHMGWADRFKPVLMDRPATSTWQRVTPRCALVRPQLTTCRIFFENSTGAFIAQKQTLSRRRTPEPIERLAASGETFLRTTKSRLQQAVFSALQHAQSFCQRRERQSPSSATVETLGPQTHHRLGDDNH
jgi:hypothetical protein